MARKSSNAVDIAIAAGDSERLRKLAARARAPETRMLQMLVAELIERQACSHRKDGYAVLHQQSLGAA